MLTLDGDWCDRGTHASLTGMNGPQTMSACLTPGALPLETWKQACPVATCFEDWVKLLMNEARTSPLLWYRQQIVDAAIAMLHASEMVTAEYNYLLVPGTYPLPVDYPPDAGNVAVAQAQGTVLAAVLEEAALDLLAVVANLKPLGALIAYLDYLPKAVSAADGNARLVKTFDGIASVVDVKTADLALAERGLLVLQRYTEASDLHPTVLEAAQGAYTKLRDVVRALRADWPSELDPIPTPPPPPAPTPLPTPSPKPLPSASRAGMSTGAKVMLAVGAGVALGVLVYTIFGGRSEPLPQLRRRTAHR